MCVSIDAFAFAPRVSVEMGENLVDHHATFTSTLRTPQKISLSLLAFISWFLMSNDNVPQTFCDDDDDGTFWLLYCNCQCRCSIAVRDFDSENVWKEKVFVEFRWCVGCKKREKDLEAVQK